MRNGFPSAVGFTVKSGWAAAVLVSGPPASPEVVDSCRVDLAEPAVPEARQPYHDGLGTARAEGPALSRLVRAVEAFGRRSVAGLLERYARAGHELSGAGIVAGSLIDPDLMGNSHIRIHALEGRLFRQVIAGAVGACGIGSATWRDRDLLTIAGGAFGQPTDSVRAQVSSLGKRVDGPWRAEQKAAALAAWLVLAGQVSVEPPRERHSRKRPARG
jgi:hypothetical protein